MQMGKYERCETGSTEMAENDSPAQSRTGKTRRNRRCFIDKITEFSGAPGDCVCCQAPVELVEKPVKLAPLSD